MIAKLFLDRGVSSFNMMLSIFTVFFIDSAISRSLSNDNAFNDDSQNNGWLFFRPIQRYTECGTIRAFLPCTCTGRMKSALGPCYTFFQIGKIVANDHQMSRPIFGIGIKGIPCLLVCRKPLSSVYLLADSFTPIKRFFAFARIAVFSASLIKAARFRR